MKYPDKRISITSLRRLYLQNGVKRKAVRQEKLVPNHITAKFDNLRQNVLAQLHQARAEGRKLLFLDEVNFTKLAIQKQEWSPRKVNVRVDQKEIYTGYQSVCACINETYGLECIQILNRAWKHPDFIKFIQNIRFENPGVPLAIYMDNLTIHKMNIVKYVYERLNIMPILNIPYCPEFNPIESVFS